MTDYLIVHDVGQGAWFWGQVWGSVTAPTEHPPQLHTPRYASQFHLLNLPGHGSDEEGDTADVRFDECVQAIVRTVDRRDMRDLVLIGHGVGGMICLQASTILPTPPRRLALIAGLIPEDNRSPISRFPTGIRKHFSRRLSWGKLVGKDSRLPPAAVAKYLCNGMDPSEITRALGNFGPLPTRLMETGVNLSIQEVPCPVSYVVLDQDRLLSPTLQINMARMIDDVEILHLDACHLASLHKPVEMGQLILGLAK